MLAYYFKVLSIKNKRLTFISQSWKLLFFPLYFSPFCSLCTTECLWVQNWQQSCSRCEHSPILCPKKNSEQKDQITYSCFKYNKSIEVIQRRFEPGKDVYEGFTNAWLLNCCDWGIKHQWVKNRGLFTRRNRMNDLVTAFLLY